MFVMDWDKGPNLYDLLIDDLICLFQAVFEGASQEPINKTFIVLILVKECACHS